MDYNTHLKKIGNSTGVIIPSVIAKMIDYKQGDKINIRINEDKSITIKKFK